MGATQLKATEDRLDGRDGDCDGHMISVVENASERVP